MHYHEKQTMIGRTLDRINPFTRSPETIRREMDAYVAAYRHKLDLG